MPRKGAETAEVKTPRPGSDTPTSTCVYSEMSTVCNNMQSMAKSQDMCHKRHHFYPQRKYGKTSTRDQDKTVDSSTQKVTTPYKDNPCSVSLPYCNLPLYPTEVLSMQAAHVSILASYGAQQNTARYRTTRRKKIKISTISIAETTT